MKRSQAGFAILLSTLVACSEPVTLSPGPGAQPAPDDPDAAIAEVAGVELTAWSDRWRGEPETLPDVVTPLLVRVENNGSERLTIRFDQFNLDNPEDGDFSPIPPYEVDETVSEPFGPNDFARSGFWVAPYLHRYYGGVPWYRDAFAFNRLYYDRMLPIWRTVELPTADMVRLALPEGVLDPGGVAMGFVYFDDVSDDPSRVTLEFELVTTGGRNIGTVRIPFTVD